MTTFNHLPALIEALPHWMDDLVTNGAEEVHSVAAVNAPVLTGRLKSTIYVSGPKGSTYGQGVTGSGELLPEEKPQDKHEAIVGVAADYGIYPELGSAHAPAHPYLIPAVDTVRPRFEARAAASLEEALARVK